MTAALQRAGGEGGARWPPRAVPAAWILIMYLRKYAIYVMLPVPVEAARVAGDDASERAVDRDLGCDASRSLRHRDSLIEAARAMNRPDDQSVATDGGRPNPARTGGRVVPPALGPRGEGWFAAQVGVLGIAAVAGLSGRPGGYGPVAAAAGLLLILSGVVLATRGVIDLAGNLTVFPRPRAGARLVDRGAYRLVRHPIYGGLILGSVGWGLVMGSATALGAAAALALLLGLKSVREEVWLTAAFADYEAYRRRTRRLIPWVV